MEIEQSKAILTDGDILHYTSQNEGRNTVTYIYKEIRNDRVRYYAVIIHRTENCYDLNICSNQNENVGPASLLADTRLATLEERQLLFSKLAEAGKKWNPTTHQLEDIHKPHVFKPFDRVLVRDRTTQEWVAGIFSHYRRGAENPYCLTDDVRKFCIPYEGNEHLIGTTDCPKGGAE